MTHPSTPRQQRASTPLLARFEALASSPATALLDGAGSSSFREVCERVRQLADALEARDIRGRRAALLAEPGREWVEGFWAILLCGATPVPLSPLHPAPEQEALLQQSSAVAFLLSEAAEATCRARHPARWVFGAGRLRAGAPQRLPAAALDAPAPALLLFTSGTTGKPKGVPLSHANVLAGVECLIEAWGMTAADRLVHCLPLHHLHGICVALLSAWCAGASTHFLPRYEPESVLGAAAKASVLMGVPTQHKRLVDYLDSLDAERRSEQANVLRALRLITSGSAKLPEVVGRRLEAWSGQYPLERYGMTEVGIVIGNPLAGPRRPGSCGKPLPGCEIRIVDETGRDLAAGAPGEIWIRGASVFAGYDADPGATAAAFADGFFKSGDTARWTPDGYVEVLGRTSIDIIKSGGYKLSAIEIEEHLRAHAWVRDVAVVGVPDETWGQRVVAVVVPSAAGEAALTDPAAASRQLQLWMKQRVASYQVPKTIVWHGELPRNSMGKVQKTELLEALGASGAAAATSD
jgi:malonyl-CoA/methylmalonyl-CoA synthetase